MSDLQNYITMLHFAKIAYREEDDIVQSRTRRIIVPMQNKAEVFLEFVQGRMTRMWVEDELQIIHRPGVAA